MPTEPNPVGKLQFFEWQSRGIKPENPDPYFLCLKSGKQWFGVQQSSIKESFLTEDWWGFYCYWKDFEGERWKLKHLFAWCEIVPGWLFKECNEEDLPF